MSNSTVPPLMSGALSTPATSTLAIWSLVLGALSSCAACITGVPAVILGILALVKINESPTALKGQGLAIAGLVTGAIGTLLTFVTLAMALPAFHAVRTKAYEVACINNVRQIVLASHQFAAANNDTLPQSLDQLRAHLAKPLACHAAESHAGPSYEIVAPGRKLSGVADPAKAVFVRETQARHRGRRAVGYMDGHVEMVRDP